MARPSCLLTILAMAPRAAAILNGVHAFPTHPEALLVNGCSGVLLSPRVVLTAGHCHAATYRIEQPRFNSWPGARIVANRSCTQFNGTAQATLHVTVVYLEDALSLPHGFDYPLLATSPPANGTLARDVGRTINGRASAELWLSAPVSLLGSAGWAGFNLVSI